MTNSIFYILGTIGLYQLLRKFNYSKKSIYISLSLLHFFPKIVEMRVLLKPEILVFAFLPWIILGIDDFFENDNRNSLILALFPVFTTYIKGSIAGMVTIFLLIKYFRKINKGNFKEILIIFLLFLFILFGVGYENYNHTEKNFFEVTTTKNYDNVAPVSFIYNLNFWDIYFSPQLGSHNDSFTGITLLDTFGDYYKVNIESADNYYFYYQLDFFKDNTLNNGLSMDYSLDNIYR